MIIMFVVEYYVVLSRSLEIHAAHEYMVVFQFFFRSV